MENISVKIHNHNQLKVVELMLNVIWGLPNPYDNPDPEFPIYANFLEYGYSIGRKQEFDKVLNFKECVEIFTNKLSLITPKSIPTYNQIVYILSTMGDKYKTLTDTLKTNIQKVKEETFKNLLKNNWIGKKVVFQRNGEYEIGIIIKHDTQNHKVSIQYGGEYFHIHESELKKCGKGFCICFQ